MRSSAINSSIDVKCYRSIHDVDETHWNAACLRDSLFCSHRFLKVVEGSNSEAALFWYLLFSVGDRPVGAAVLSAFDVRFDLLISPAMQRFCRRVRRMVPQFMKSRVLFCGLPVSIGRHALMINAPELKSNVATAVVREMHQVARGEGIRYLCLKEFPEEMLPDIKDASQNKLFKAPSVPRVHLPIRWPDFAGYLEHMRHGYRRQVRSSLHKLRDDIEIVTGGRDVCSAAEFYPLYSQVMGRTPTKLEILNEGFFQELYEQFEAELTVIAIKRDHEVLGAALLIQHRGELTFLFVGIDYPLRDRYDVYFNLLNAIVELAISGGFAILDLGQTSYEPKLRLGGEPHPMRFYFGATSRPRYLLLKALSPLLFPDYEPPRRRVFHTPDDGLESQKQPARPTAHAVGRESSVVESPGTSASAGAACSRDMLQ